MQSGRNVGPRVGTHGFGHDSSGLGRLSRPPVSIVDGPQFAAMHFRIAFAMIDVEYRNGLRTSQ
jgi:hypothetical protein